MSCFVLLRLHGVAKYILSKYNAVMSYYGVIIGYYEVIMGYSGLLWVILGYYGVLSYRHLRANTTLRQNSFWLRTIPDWNPLPAAAIESKTVAAFKSQLVD